MAQPQHPRTPRARLWTIPALVALAITLAVLRLSMGPAATGGVRLAWPDDPQVWRLRLDRVALASIVGASLALGGVFLQNLLRNPLASPDLIGASAGAGLGVMLAALLAPAGGVAAGYAGVLGGVSTTAALIGAGGAMAIVYALSQRRGLVDPVGMILVGVMVSVVAGAATVLVGHLMPDRGLAVSRWMIGTLSDEVRPLALVVSGGIAVGAMAIGLALARHLDIATLHEDEARSLGVHVHRLRLAIFLLVALLTASAVTLAGPIGFVGLVCPHLARLLGGPAHRGLVPAAALAGVCMLLAADVLVRALDVAGGRLPIGVITALVGGPVFLLMLRTEARRFTR